MFIMRILPFALVALLFTACSKNSDSPPPPPKPQQEDIAVIDTRAQTWMTQNNMPGLTLAISKNGKLVYAKGYGLSDKEAGTPVTTETEFRIASVSKLFTSVAVMKLVQDGKISMDQKVFGNGSILGSTYGGAPFKPWVTDITVSHLLHHTGGGWGQANDPTFFDQAMDAAALINYTINNVNLASQPGTAFDYSNFGYVILEKIIEKASGKSYYNYVNDEIFKKVGAKQTVIANTSLGMRGTKEAKYYSQGGDAGFVYDHMNFTRAAGAYGWKSTPTDMLRFVLAVDSSNTRPDILNRQTIKTMVTTTPASVGWGMQFGCGWVIENGEWFWWGSLPGTFAILYRNENGICIAAAANSRRMPTPENGLNSFIANIINFAAFDQAIPWQDIDQFD